MNHSKTAVTYIGAALLAALIALACLAVFRDTFSLVYWRIRLFRLPRATGSGPRQILSKSRVCPFTVDLIGISEKEWQVSRKWVSTVQVADIGESAMLVTMGCWWDDSWHVTSLPLDSAGTFTHPFPRKMEVAKAPVQTQIAIQSKPALGTHIITPPGIGSRGDGSFLVLKIKGIDMNSPVRDHGQVRDAHPHVGLNDPNSIESITVSTEGAFAEAGDLAIAIFAFDACENPDVRVDLPEGWTSVGFNNVALQNLGYRACCRVVTEAGRQTATCHWKDKSTFAAEACLLILKRGN